MIYGEIPKILQNSTIVHFPLQFCNLCCDGQTLFDLMSQDY